MTGRCSSRAAAEPVRVRRTAPHETALLSAADASSANIESLLASVMNWQPAAISSSAQPIRAPLRP